MSVSQNGVLIGACLAISALSLTYLTQAKNMAEIRFDLGGNITETAKRSGVPEFSVRDVDGFISYSINNLNDQVQARFGRPGYELDVGPLFAFTMYANTENRNTLGVYIASLQFDSKVATSHEDGQRFAESLIQRIGVKKWTRHIEDTCPAVTGRSSFLNAAGEIDLNSGCALDPAHRFTKEEWIKLMESGQEYRWHGDNVLLTLKISTSNDSRGITYKFFMDFEDLAIKTKRDAQRQKRDLEEGDKKGWNSTQDYEKGMKERKETIKRLEANAIRRGDRVIPRQ